MSTNHWKEELELVEAAALRIEALELKAESDFDRVSDAAQAQGEPSAALGSPEFQAWMSARHDSDAAWGRWFEVMGARPPEEQV